MANLKSPTARLELDACKRYTAKLGGGLSLVYRRGKDGTASWSAAMADGKGGQVLGDRVAVVFAALHMSAFGTNTKSH